MNSTKDPGYGRGLLVGVSAYLIWGSFPLIIAMLGFVGWRGTAEPNQVAEADKGGAEISGDPDALASALAKRGSF